MVRASSQSHGACPGMLGPPPTKTGEAPPASLPQSQNLQAASRTGDCLQHVVQDLPAQSRGALIAGCPAAAATSPGSFKVIFNF
ncbi:hypothetical protein OE88DRAFT_1659743 [Heliocybe sulcata]|uniref:Uncharacterized protein n=1 Tax=Heliocybe sulcata TaxID=5364 RepID=A0A5C3N3N7_9AGAM|nr:hypothetical protein OE88DRAFT_1659743 [Heliocybe sulcata]